MNDDMSLSEYRMMHPHSASVPTVTQSGLLGQVLERHRQHAARLAMHRARQQRVADTFIMFATGCRVLIAGVVRGCSEAINAITAAPLRLKSMHASKHMNAQRYPRGVVGTTYDLFGNAARERALPANLTSH